MIANLVGILGSKAFELLASIAGIIAAVGAIFALGVRSNKKATKIKNLKDYVDTQERINEVTINTDASTARRRLRKYGKLRD